MLVAIRGNNRSNHLMTRRWRSVVLLPIIVVMLSGCFRQASNQIDPLESQPISSTSQSSGNDVPTTAPTSNDSGGDDATPTPETLIQPTATEPDVTPVIAITVETSTPIVPATSAPATATTVPTDDNTIPTATTEFITPAPVQPTSAVSSPVPTITNTSAPLVTPTQLGIDVVSDECLYTVRSGDNLFRIATSNNVSVEDLRAANPDLVGDIIQPGDQLILPDCGDVVLPTQPPASTCATKFTGPNDPCRGIRPDVGCYRPTIWRVC